MKLFSQAFKNGHIDLKYGKHGDKSLFVDGRCMDSFPVQWTLDNKDSKYIHLLFLDWDAIPVVGAPIIHWSVANIKADEYKDGLIENASNLWKDKLTQGINYLAKKDVKSHEVLLEATSFIGCAPRKGNHNYHLYAWTSKEPLPLKNSYWVNELMDWVLKHHPVEEAKLIGMYPDKLDER